MVTLSEAQKAGIVTLVLILSGAVTVQYMEKTYYCEAEDSVKECLKISSSGITCYMLNGTDRCSGGTWKPLANILEKAGSAGIIKSGEDWYLKTDEGKCFRHGDLRLVEKCP